MPENLEGRGLRAAVAAGRWLILVSSAGEAAEAGAGRGEVLNTGAGHLSRSAAAQAEHTHGEDLRVWRSQQSSQPRGRRCGVSGLRCHLQCWHPVWALV